VRADVSLFSHFVDFADSIEHEIHRDVGQMVERVVH
jgi:hypothetical protein